MSLIISGVQPTGNLHLGNYLGAIKNWVELQEKGNLYFFIADLHAITVQQNPAELRENVLKVAALYIACGIDVEKSTIFAQSAVPGHAELAWILGCNTPLGSLMRMTQFKDKAQIKEIKNINPAELKGMSAVEGLKVIQDEFNRKQDAVRHMQGILDALSGAKLGLFSYPVLMAADILLYNATHVPVGDDQRQHLELARDIAGAFNRNYGTEFFNIPEPLFTEAGARVMSLQDYRNKMSKSDASEYSRINLTDDDEVIRGKVKKAKTDSIAEVTYKPAARPDVANLINLIAVLRGETPQAVEDSLQGKKSSDLKNALAEALITVVAPIRGRYLELIGDKAGLKNILAKGAEKANGVAAKNLDSVKKLVGLS